MCRWPLFWLFISPEVDDKYGYDDGAEFDDDDFTCQFHSRWRHKLELRCNSNYSFVTLAGIKTHDVQVVPRNTINDRLTEHCKADIPWRRILQINAVIVRKFYPCDRKAINR